MSSPCSTQCDGPDGRRPPGRNTTPTTMSTFPIRDRARWGTAAVSTTGPQSCQPIVRYGGNVTEPWRENRSVPTLPPWRAAQAAATVMTTWPPNASRRGAKADDERVPHHPPLERGSWGHLLAVGRFLVKLSLFDFAKRPAYMSIVAYGGNVTEPGGWWQPRSRPPDQASTRPRSATSPAPQ
jgi:hypothetical protein